LPSDEQLRDGKNSEQQVVHASRDWVAARKDSEIERPRSVSTKVNSAAIKSPSTKKPAPRRVLGVGARAKRRTTQRAAKKVTASMSGASISSATLFPTRGTI
jgi:hypothetical protein